MRTKKTKTVVTRTVPELAHSGAKTAEKKARLHFGTNPTRNQPCDRNSTAGALRVLAFAFVIVAMSAILLQAQTTTASSGEKKLAKEYALLFGTVWSPQGRPVYGVHLKIRRADEKKPRWERISDHNGEFAVRVPPGKADYIVTAEIKASKAKARPEMTVHVDNDERVDFGLHLTE
jgi:hypothetical protein